MSDVRFIGTTQGTYVDAVGEKSGEKLGFVVEGRVERGCNLRSVQLNRALVGITRTYQDLGDSRFLGK